MSGSSWQDYSFPGLVGLIGLGFVVIPLSLLAGIWRRVHQDRSWPRISGEVDTIDRVRRVRTRSDGPDDVRYVLVADYHYRHPGTGEVLRGRGDVPDRLAIGPGDAVTLVHHPKDPRRSRFHEANTKGSLAGTGCMSVVLLAFTAVGGALLALAVLLTP